MRKIWKIEIKNFRSVKSEIVSDINDLNIFSGGNDVGKSNVLRALDIFFNEKNINFAEEYNIYVKSGLTTTKQKQIISVKVWFINDVYKNLPPKFFIKRTWDKSGKICSQQHDIENWRVKKGNITQKQAYTALSQYLNRFRFTYVPAIKDNEFFNNLLVNLYEAIVNNTVGSEDEFSLTLQTFNDKLSELSRTLSETFKERSGINSTISIPTNVNELAKRLSVSTYNEDNPTDRIPLFNRGDGIRMHYIPSIIYQISQLEKNKWHIWAFDEPETSCEYAKAASLAKEFLELYSKSCQIFISSHSFHFITINGEKVSRYRVIKESNNSSVKDFKKELFIEQELQSELGVLKLLEGLQEVYDEFQKERKLIENNLNIINSATKPLLMFEGESDRILFKKAFEKIKPEESDNFIYSEPADEQEGGAIGEGATSLGGFLFSHIPKIGEVVSTKKIIAVFDNDKEGVEQFNKIAKKYSKFYEKMDIEGCEVLKHKRFSVYIMKLIAPEFRENFVHNKAKYCYLSTELLLRNNSIPSANMDKIPHTNPPIFSFNSKNKVNFANNLSIGETDFTGFQETIDMMVHIKDLG